MGVEMERGTVMEMATGPATEMGAATAGAQLAQPGGRRAGRTWRVREERRGAVLELENEAYLP